MSKLLRYYAPGQNYFVTTVTYERAPILVRYAEALLQSIDEIQGAEGFRMPAWVIMPEHFHAVIDPGQADLSRIMKRIKLKFAYLYRNANNLRAETVWQRRFWDHILRDERDWRNKLDYIHYNPVNHGVAATPRSWPYSSIHDYGDLYSDDWGVVEPLGFEGSYGE
jgi:putative transposase